MDASNISHFCRLRTISLLLSCNYLATCQLTAHLVDYDLSLEEHQIILSFICVGRHWFTQTPLSNPRLVGANQT